MDKKILEKYTLVKSIVEKIGDDELTTLSTFLSDRITNVDSYVMMLGETSSGKSTIINGLMGENTLFVSSAPSTGSITEIEFKNEVEKNQLYAINRDATIEKIDSSIFNDLLRKPDENLQRLKLVTKATKYNLSNMRLFDTPGYGSIIKEHEEVLKEFIPNSDVIIYTINYKIGIQENDYAFIRFLKELIRENVEIILLINRCPSNVSNVDRRVTEVRRYISDILHKDIKTFFVKTEQVEDEYGYALPKAEELWTYVEEAINSPKRIKLLEEAFDGYILELLGRCELIIDKQYQNIKLSKEVKEAIKARSKKFVDNVNNLIPTLIEPTFDKLIEAIPSKLDIARSNIEATVVNSIDKVSNVNMDETISYVCNHLLPYSTGEEILEVKRYIEITLEDLNNKVTDYLNTEIIEFNKDIEICFSTSTELVAKSFSKKIGGKVVSGGLTKYFAGFGGAGGAGAGVANAASHALKVVGNFFGKTFKRQTHNALKRVLAKIGATSLKTIANVAVVIIELATLIVDYTTWKGKLKKKTKKAIDEWYVEASSAIKEDLMNLKKENIDILKLIIKEETNKYDYDEEIKDEAEIVKLLETLEVLKAELGV